MAKSKRRVYEENLPELGSEMTIEVAAMPLERSVRTQRTQSLLRCFERSTYG
ncbi:MAG: hypothetical protein M3Y76_13605 [Chloroflexota bacterium]|nr:hypothetical protein [Chloroflexota bacterium]